MSGYIGSLVEAKVETLALQAGTVLLNAGLSFLVTLLVNKAVGAWQKYQQGLRDSAEAAKRTAEEFENTKSKMEEYIDAYNKLGDNSKWDTSSMEQAKQLQEQILELFKDQGGQMDGILDKIDLQNGKYEEQKQLLTDINIQNAKNNAVELKTNLTNAQKDLQSSIGFFDSKGDYTDLRGSSAKEAQYLASKGIGNAYGNGNRADYYLGDFDFSKADDVVAAYDRVNEAIAALVSNYSTEELAESELYSSLTSLKGQLEDNVNAYQDALDAYNNNQAIIEVGEALKTTTIDSKEAFDNFIESLSEGKGYTEEYKQALYNVASNAFPQFADAANNAADANNGLDESWKVDTPQRLANFLASLSDSSSDLYAKTKALTSAYNDMYQNQKLSSDSIQALISAYPELINQMETENGVTTISKEVLSDKFETIKASMVATIESEIQATQTAINEAKQRIAIYQHEMRAITTLYSAIGMIVNAANNGSANELSEEEFAAAKKYQAAQQGIEEMQQTIKDANAQLADQKKALEVLNNITLPNYAGATKGSSAANKGATQAAKENKKALEAQKKEAEKTKKELENYSKTLKAQGDAIIKVLDKRKDALEKEKDARDKAWDKEKDQLEEQQKLQDKVYDKQKEALEEKKKALQDANDEEDRAIKLAQLQDELAKAQSQRTKRVYQHDTGFEWQTDGSAVSDAQNNLDDQQRTWKREDAIDAVEKEIDAIEKLKDAYDEEVDAAVDAIEKQKDAYDDSIDAQIDKIEEMKDKYQEVLNLIGMSWDEYQAMLDATALANGMSLDSMGEYLVGFKENVIANLKQVSDAEAEVQRLTDAISGIDTSSSSGGSGGGGTGGGGFPGLSASVADTSQKLKELTGDIKKSTDEISSLKDKEEILCDKLSNGNLTTSERIDVMTQLGAVQSDIGEEEENLTNLAGQYVTVLGEETDATDEYREAALNQLQLLTEGYNVNYEAVFDILQKHLQDVADTESGTSELYNSMSSTVDLFSTNVVVSLESLGGSFDTLVTKVQTAADEIEKTCKTAIDNLKEMKKAAETDDSDGSDGAHHAIGSRGIQRSGRAIVDEEGPELIARQNLSNGRYAYLERGDAVLPASFTKNLWDMGANPGEWFERQYSKFNRMDNSKAVYAGGTTVYSPSFTGDIVITNPVANSDDLARSLKQNLPASFMQAVGVRM